LANHPNKTANRHTYRVAVATAVVAAVVFLLIAADIAYEGGLTSLDFGINRWLHSHGTPGAITFFLWISWLHSNPIIMFTTVAISGYLWFRHLRRWLLMLGISVFGGMLLNVGLKLLFARARPHFDDPIVILKTFSFPSGHTMTATVFYGALCVFALSRIRNWKLQAPMLVLSTVMIALVGFSRMYLGVHYLTDVIGAIVEGLMWVALSSIVSGVVRKEGRV
jgi:undecaprenyl-diphosphatase